MPVIPATSYSGQTVGVFGLARSGLTAATSLVEGGAEVLAWDDRDTAQDAARADGIPVRDLRDADWTKIAALVLSPGIPHDLPEAHWSATLARDHNVPIICDVEIFVREMAAKTPRPRLVAITGTNGKSTTTALTGHILRSAGRDAHVGGNIGRGVLDLPPPGADTTYVLELSSYQLERAPSLHADVAVFLNLSPDHLERHGDMAGYEAAKRNIFANQTKSDTAVIGVDDAVGKRIVTHLKARNGRTILPVSTRSAVIGGVSVRDGKLLDATGPKSPDALDLSPIDTLQGRHNHQNAAAAYAATQALGLPRDEIVAGLRSFPGLAHRMEIVGRAGPILFVNDSKATNADSAAQALGTFEHIHWIAGGLPKSGGIEDLRPHFDRIERAYLVGAAAAEFARTLDAHGVAHAIVGDVPRAVMAASADAFRAGQGVVLLSPACASFDQYKDFEARGDAFREAVAPVLDAYRREAGGRG